MQKQTLAILAQYFCTAVAAGAKLQLPPLGMYSAFQRRPTYSLMHHTIACYPFGPSRPLSLTPWSMYLGPPVFILVLVLSALLYLWLPSQSCPWDPAHSKYGLEDCELCKGTCLPFKVNGRLSLTLLIMLRTKHMEGGTFDLLDHLSGLLLSPGDVSQGQSMLHI